MSVLKKMPETMRAIQMDEPGQSLIIRTVPVPEMGKNEVLVKMFASPINPSDLAFLKGGYTPILHFPVVPGIEGSGTVVAAGSGFLAKRLLGKTVMCSPSNKGGTWAEYMVTGATKCIPLGKQISLEQGATMIVNPLTALAMIEYAKTNKHKAIVINAAASSLGKMMVALCNIEHISCVAIVRKPQQIEMLKDLGANVVVISGEAAFAETLKKSIDSLNATLALDAIAGKMTETLVAVLPKYGEVLIYGRLSGELPVLDPKELIQNGKKIAGFYLANYMHQQNIIKAIMLTNKVKRYIRNADFKTHIAKTIVIDEINDAIAFYAKNMSEGKILITF